MTDQVEGLEVISPKTDTVEFMGETITVSPLKVGQIPGVLRALKGVDFTSGLDMIALLMEGSEQVIDAVCIAARIPKEKAAEAEIDEFLRVGAVVIEVNADFFVRRVAPLLMESLQKVNKQMAGAGLTPFKP